MLAALAAYRAEFGPFNEEPETRLAQFKICYPADMDAVDLWRMIFDELTGRFGNTADTASLDPEAAAETMQNADTNNQLQMFLIPFYLCFGLGSHL